MILLPMHNFMACYGQMPLRGIQVKKQGMKTASNACIIRQVQAEYEIEWNCFYDCSEPGFKKN